MSGKGLTRKQQRAQNRQQSENPAGNRPGGVPAIGVSYRSGPLPSPKDLAEYNQIVPGLANTLVGKFTQQTDHRIEIESIVVKGNDKRSTRGQWMAYSLAMAAIVGGIYLIANDKPTAGLVAIISAISGLVVVFVTGKVFQERERREKRQGM